MVTSPDQNAFYMHVNAVMDGVQVDSQRGANLGRDLAIGPEVETEPFCLQEYVLQEGSRPLSLWISGETFDDYHIMSNGQAFSGDVLGMGGGPGSRVGANVLVCPYEESDE